MTQLAVTKPSEVATAILRMRSAAGFTQQQLANRIGTTQTYISSWECGERRPNAESLLKVVQACGYRWVFAGR